MLVYIQRDEFHYDISEYLNVFFHGENIEFTDDLNAPYDLRFNINERSMEAFYFKNGESVYESCIGNEHPMILELSNDKTERLKGEKRLIKHLIYDIGTSITNVKAPWGILTGIRPTKLVFDLVEKYGRDKKTIKLKLLNEFKISEEKVNLLLEVVGREGEILYDEEPKGISIYIGIPFCPTTCVYCSFASYPVGCNKNVKIISDYLVALEKEIQFIAKSIAKDKVIQSIYIGGGTPTVLNESQLEKLLQVVSENFNLETIKEFTVEAGRPDTINSWKLDILKKYNVTRISINPQTMNQETLGIIGRNHKVDDIHMAYRLAKGYGFIINMDLIIGLPGESSVDVLYTMEELWKMMPENVTIHTLAIKSGSKMKESIDQYRMASTDEIEVMLNITRKQIEAMNLKPYYMYRQKNMVGNFENIGYAKKGKECFYNIIMIEEVQTVIALGAGAVSKIIPKNKKIERIENVKNVNEYINRIDEMIERKKKFFKTYKG